MRVLALDCSGAACSSAVVVCPDGAPPKILSRKIEQLRRGHAERIIPMIAECLTDADLTAQDLDLVAATIGPGAFTGIRVGLAAAQGLARAAGCKAVGVRVTDAFAEQVAPEAGRPLLVALDSRRQDPFCAVFTANGAERWRGGAPEAVHPSADSFSAFLKKAEASGDPLIVGDAADLVSSLLPAASLQESAGHCDPVHVGVLAARSARAGTALSPTPLYLRAPDVSDPTKDRYRAKQSAS